MKRDDPTCEPSERYPEEVDPEQAAIPYPFPFPFPTRLARASGLYIWQSWPRPIPYPYPVPRQPLPVPQPRIEAELEEPPTTELAENELSPIPWWFAREELRLDIDGYYPQMTVSGTTIGNLFQRVHWVAQLSPAGRDRWSGSIWHKDGKTGLMPYTNVIVQVKRSWLASQRTATVTFVGRGLRPRVRTFRWKSSYFHSVDFEFDNVTPTKPVLSIDPTDHPNHAPGLRSQTLTVQDVFRRAGFNVTTSSSSGPIPISGAGNDRWSDMEMHDAMQTYWSRFADKPQWAMWCLNAGLHEMGTSLGGIMFDDIGPNHRQGTAIFNEAFIANAPAGDADAIAWVKRMKFWTVVHEMGHAFNLAHSWQKAMGTPWIPLANEPEARSFMNYPFKVSGGQTAFFSDFEFKFSDQEHLFLRHAPARFVQMGNADWFDHHGFENALVSPEPTFRLGLRLSRPQDKPFEFLEPVVLEVGLTNTSSQPQLVDEQLLNTGEHLTIVLKKQGKAARQWVPFAVRLFAEKKVLLAPGETLPTALLVSAGLNGWDLAEPGTYLLQAALHLHGEDVVSAPVQLRVAPPRSYEEERLGQELFTEDVGRVLSFGGSMFLTQANDTLRLVAEQMSDRRVALHARYALANPLARDYRCLSVDPKATRLFTAQPANESATEELRSLLVDDAEQAVETFGKTKHAADVSSLKTLLHHEEAEEGTSEDLNEVLKGLERKTSRREKPKPDTDKPKKLGV